MEINSDGLPHKIFFYIVITVNQKISHVCDLSPLQFGMSIAEFKGQHVRRLAHNHNIVDDGVV